MSDDVCALGVAASSPKQKPCLSVVMPVHEGAEWIGATLESLASAHTSGLEIIIIDSSPTASTRAIVQQFTERLPIRLLIRQDLTPWQAKTNLAVDLAEADHVCILHQDDLWLPNRLGAVRGWVAKDPEAVLHFAPTKVIDRHGRDIGHWRCPLPSERKLNSEFVLERLLVQNFVAVPATVFRRSAWLESGGMDEGLWYTPDWDIWLKLAASGTVVYHEQATTAFRVHGSSLTMTGSRDAADFRSQMRIVLDRHLWRLPQPVRRRTERAASASISINVSLAAASAGSVAALRHAVKKLLLLGPMGMHRYLRDSRLQERVMPRVRAKWAGAL